jgi:hypothetical protein
MFAEPLECCTNVPRTITKTVLITRMSRAQSRKLFYVQECPAHYFENCFMYKNVPRIISKTVLCTRMSREHLRKLFYLQQCPAHHFENCFCTRMSRAHLRKLFYLQQCPAHYILALTAISSKTSTLESRATVAAQSRTRVIRCNTIPCHNDMLQSRASTTCFHGAFSLSTTVTRRSASHQRAMSCYTLVLQTRATIQCYNGMSQTRAFTLGDSNRVHSRGTVSVHADDGKYGDDDGATRPIVRQPAAAASDSAAPGALVPATVSPFARA